jgi:hypothetical protein
MPPQSCSASMREARALALTLAGVECRVSNDARRLTSVLGQTEKNSVGAPNFRFASEPRHCLTEPACRKNATGGSEPTHSITSSVVARSAFSQSPRRYGCIRRRTVSLAVALSATAGTCGDQGPIVGAPLAPDITVPVPTEIAVRIAILRVQDN